MNSTKAIIIICAVIIAICVIGLILFLIRKRKQDEDRGIPDLIQKGELPDKLPHRGYYTYISGADHKTDMYRFRKNDIFVARRGMPFKITNKKINLQAVNIQIFQMVNEFRAKNDLRSNRPESMSEVGIINTKSSWNTLPISTQNIKIESRQANEVTFSSDINASIGKYLIKFGETEIIVYLLFNPFNKEDTTYFPEQNMLDEYILNQNGFVYKGSLEEPDYIIWNYAQFEENVFLGVMSLITYLEGYKEYDGTDPVSVSRNITFILPNNLLSGFWANDTDITWHQDPDVESEQRLRRDLIACNREADCDPLNNVCQQPYFKENPDYDWPKVCGYSVPDTGEGTKKLSDYIPSFQSDLFKSCNADADCEDLDLPLPAQYSESGADYQKGCIKAKICGYDAYSPGENALYKSMVEHLRTPELEEFLKIKKCTTTNCSQEEINKFLGDLQAFYQKLTPEQKRQIPDTTDANVIYEAIKDLLTPALLKDLQNIGPCRGLPCNTERRKAIIRFFYALDEDMQAKVLADYTRTKSPSFWSSSLQIFNVYLENLIASDYKKLQHVLYGQCWVFGALTTSFCRSIGIPCRQLAVYKAFHERCGDPQECFDSSTHQYSGRFRDKNPITGERGNGKVWIFHNWNDVWLRRTDLTDDELNKPQWQAIDSTPQEISDGVNQLGPAPLAAVRRKLAIKFDTSFVTNEVNYEGIIHGGYERVTTLALTSKPLSTNIINNPNMKFKDISVDITDQYVDPPIHNLARALQAAPSQRLTLQADALGETGPIKVNFTMISNQSGEVTYKLEGYNITYRGDLIGESPDFSASGKVNLKENRLSSLTKLFDPRKVNTRISKYFKFFITATFPDGATLSNYEEVYLIQPKIDVRLSPCCKVQKDKTYTLFINFKNPYQEALTGCELHIFSQGIIDTRIKVNAIQPGQTFSKEFPFRVSEIPDLKYSAFIINLSSSDHVNNFDGYRTFAFEK